VNGKPRLKGPFVVFANDEGIAACDIAEALKGWHPDCVPVPATLLAKLDLPHGSNITAVANAVIALFNAPIVMTPEEEGEEEMAMLVMSEAIEKARALNPDLPQIPVLYPKEKRTKH
jgi:hypothetical protein